MNTPQALANLALAACNGDTLNALALTLTSLVEELEDSTPDGARTVLYSAIELTTRMENPHA